MTLLEICGNPGVGKSTAINLIEELIRERGKKTCILMTNLYKDTPIKWVRRKITNKVIRIASVVYSRTNHLKDLLTELSVYYHSSRVWMNNILRYNYLLSRKKLSKYDYVIMDEGILQNVSSILHDSICDDNINDLATLLNRQIYDKRKIVLVRCVLDLDSNINRIETRNRSNDRFNVGTTNEKKKRLYVKSSNISIISKKLHFDEIYEINMQNTQVTVQDFVNELLKKGVN